jgi:hypothetical protein
MVRSAATGDVRLNHGREGVVRHQAVLIVQDDRVVGVRAHGDGNAARQAVGPEEFQDRRGLVLDPIAEVDVGEAVRVGGVEGRLRGECDGHAVRIETDVRSLVQ